MKKVTIFNETFEVKKVNKANYEIFAWEAGYYSIQNSKQRNNDVWGGDAACDDHYDLDLAQSIYDQWSGYLFDGKIDLETEAIYLKSIK
jgi:hypothetical protein